MTNDAEHLRPGMLDSPDPEMDTISFQLVELDHHLALKTPGFLGRENSMVPILDMFGITKEGHSTLCHVHGFNPYFYVFTKEKPNISMLETFREMLNDKVKDWAKVKVQPLPEMVLAVEHVTAKSIYGYSGKEQHHFLKIVVAVPQAVPPLAAMFQNGIIDSMGVYFKGSPDKRAHILYESNIDYKARFMTDLLVQGSSWIELPLNTYKLREPQDYTSHCQIECDVNYTDFIAHPPDGEWATIAPLRIMSFDIETYVNGDRMPDPRNEAALQISSVVSIHGFSTPLIKCIFTWRSCAPISGVIVKSYKTEPEMLMAWSEFIIQVDPDIITGYWILGFDLPFLIGRAKKLGLTRFPFIGRLRDKPTEPLVWKTKRPRFNAFGINSRIVLDLCEIFKRDHANLVRQGIKSLNKVSDHFLKMQKDDVHFSEIPKLFDGNDVTRRRLAEYCIKDSELVMMLLYKLNCISDYIEMSRVTGMRLSDLIVYGRNNKVILQILREAKKYDYLLPVIPNKMGEDINYNSTMSLPAKSPYPAIIIAQNLCYTTLLTQETIVKYYIKPEEYIKTPNGSFFKKPDEDHQTILPEIIKNLLSAHMRVNNNLSRETDLSKKTIIESRKLALEMSVNSFKSFINHQEGHLPCSELSDSISAFG